jgi:lysyl endopeptidase
MSPQSLLRSTLAVIFGFTVLSTSGLAQVSLRKEAAVYQGSTQTAAVKAKPLSWSIPLNRPGSVRLNGLSANEASKLVAPGGKRIVGLHRGVPKDALGSGVWTTLPDGRGVWRLSIASAGAAAVRIQFSDFSVGNGSVWLYANGATQDADGPYTGQGPYGNGEFWSASIAGENVVIEYAAAGKGSDTVLPFRVERVSHQVARIEQEMEAARVAQEKAAGFQNLVPPAVFSPNASPLPDYAASCQADVQCYPDWQTTKRSVAELLFEETQGDAPGTYVCSGSLVATRDNSFKPYLLTAGHCIHDEAAARSLQVWWAYDSPGCNQGPPVDRGPLKSTAGGHLLTWGALHDGDYSLVLLPDVPNGVVFSGWDIGDIHLGAPVVGIHHPMGSYKRISMGTTVESIDATIEGDTAPAALYTDVVWDLGITEPGSSGSPLFSGPGVITGMLTYGPAAPGELLCSSGSFGGYGKFSNAYPYLLDYLENLPATIVTPSVTALQFTGRNRVVTGNTSQAVTLTVQAASAIPFVIRPDDNWLVVSASSGTVSATAPVTIQVSVDPRYLLQTGRYTSTIAILSGSATPQYINVTMDMKIDVSNVTVSAIPSPVPQTDGTWSLKLQLVESGGADTKITGLRIDGADYSTNLSKWFGASLLPANGTLQGSIHTSGLFPPVDKYFEFLGQDVATGATWYRTMTVTFLP